MATTAAKPQERHKTRLSTLQNENINKPSRKHLECRKLIQLPRNNVAVHNGYSE